MRGLLTPRLRNASPQRRLASAGVLLALLLAVGVGGYMAIEGWSFLDALYMTVITVTTIGFREVQPLSRSGQVFTMVLAVAGVGAMFYALISLFQFLLEGELATILGVRRMKPALSKKGSTMSTRVSVSSCRTAAMASSPTGPPL